MSLFDVVAVLFTAFVTVDMARYLKTGQTKRDFSAFRTLRRGRWALAVLVVPALIAVTLALGLALLTYGGPILRWSWLSLLQVGSKAEPQAQNLMVAGLKYPWFAWVFLGLFAVNVPRLAKREEQAFRQHVRGIGPALWQSLKFGLAHCLVGVPVGIGLALFVPGLFFAYVYSRGGVRLSTAWHAVYNYFILAAAVLWMLKPG